MPDVFISYSRKDLAFVERLRTLLEAAGLSVWVDIEGLFAGEEFWPEVAKAVDAALAAIFVMSPDSMTSKFFVLELERAADGEKRIVPLLHREVDAAGLHPALAKRQWVFFRDADDPAAAMGTLLSAVRADWVQLRQQARLLVRAREWQTKERDGSLLLRGRDLRQAEDWLAHSHAREDGAPALVGEFIRASRSGSRRRTLRLAGFTIGALAIIVMVSWFAAGQRVASLSNLSLDDLKQGRAEPAITRLEGARRLCARFAGTFKGCPDAGLNLGQAYLDAGRFGDALKQLSAIIERAPGADAEDAVAIDFRATAHQDRAFAHIMLAESPPEALRRLDHYGQAQEDMDTAAALYARTPGGGAGKGLGITSARIHLGRGEYTEALNDLEAARRVTDVRDIDLLLSLVHHCMGDRKQSLEHFQRYINALPDRLQNPEWKLNKDYYGRMRERCKPAG